MDTSWKNNDKAEQAAEPNNRQSAKQYLRCGRGIKRGLVALAVLASVLMVLGAQNLLMAEDVITGASTGRYTDSVAMHMDLYEAANWLREARAESAPGGDTARLGIRIGLLDSDYRYCVLDDAGARAWGNATEAEMQRLPILAEVYDDGSFVPKIQDGKPRSIAVAEGAALVGYVGIDELSLALRESEALREYRLGWMGIGLLGGGTILLAFATVVLMMMAGRRPESQDVFLVWYDWMYLDIQCILTIALSAGGLVWAFWLYATNRSGLPLAIVLQCAICTVVSLLCLAFLTSCSRRIKRGEFWRHTLVGVCCRKLWGFVKRCASALMGLLKALSPTLLQGTMLALFLIGLIIAWYFHPNGFTMLIAALLLAGVTAYLYAEQRIALGIKRMRQGEADARITAPKLSSALQKGLIDDLNHMAEGMEQAVAERVKAQSMRTELITNVSHDLKTPLTSIMAYVELLKQAELPPPEGEYVEVLSEKAERLKRLTEDLFEAAKAASGSIPIRPERLDVNELLRQGIAELDDRIEKSGLDWRTELPEEPLYAVADGRHLWRVVENLCGNALKYAMPGTRVWLTAGAGGENVTITIKNISKEPLNIPAEQLTERFVRGDSSRSTEGSGLGLSIAKSLTELMGGRFTLTIDGDLFKAEVAVPKA